MRNDPVMIYFESLIRETDLAYYIEFADSEEWIPKSETMDFSEEYKEIEIPEWLAHEKGLI